VLCGGWLTEFKNLKWSNVKYRTQQRWDWDFIGLDSDGSLTGKANSVVVYNDSITVNNQCDTSQTFFEGGAVCTLKNTWLRLAFNSIVPNSIVLVNFTDANGFMVSSPLMQKRLTHPKGFMLSLQANQAYTVAFDQALYPVNISFTGAIYGLNPGDYIIFNQQLAREPDRVQYGSSVASLVSNQIPVPITPQSPSGSWYWKNQTNTFTYIISNPTNAVLDVDLKLSVFKCLWYKCIPPTASSDKLPINKR
jgi:hypothetical protein